MKFLLLLIFALIICAAGTGGQSSRSKRILTPAPIPTAVQGGPPGEEK